MGFFKILGGLIGEVTAGAGGAVYAAGEALVNKVNGKSNEEIQEKFNKTVDSATETGREVGGEFGDKVLPAITAIVIGGAINRERDKGKKS